MGGTLEDMALALAAKNDDHTRHTFIIFSNVVAYTLVYSDQWTCNPMIYLKMIPYILRVFENPTDRQHEIFLKNALVQKFIFLGGLHLNKALLRGQSITLCLVYLTALHYKSCSSKRPC